MPSKAPAKKKADHKLALRAFFELGRDRTLAKLINTLRDAGYETSETSIRAWSKNERWAVQAKAFDEAVEREVSRQQIDRKARETGEVMAMLQDTGARMLDKAAELLDHIGPEAVKNDPKLVYMPANIARDMIDLSEKVRTGQLSGDQAKDAANHALVQINNGVPQQGTSMKDKVNGFQHLVNSESDEP